MLILDGKWIAIKPLEITTTAVTAAAITPAEQAATQAAIVTATEKEEKAYSRIWFDCEEVNQMHMHMQLISKGADAWRILKGFEFEQKNRAMKRF